MDPAMQAFLLLAAVIFTAAEAARTRSLGWAGVAVALVVPLWDAMTAL
jgi:hypothetical protein